MRKCLSLAVILLACSAASVAQSNNATRGGIGGVVIDPSGAVIPNAAVTITGPQGTSKTTSDASGHYAVTGLTPGMYKVTVDASGFKSFVSNNNEVIIDHTQSLDATMTVGSGGETVTVEGGIVQIDTQDTSLNTAVTDTLYQAVPLPRAVSSAFYVAPGVSSGGGTGVDNPSIGGASGLENLYIADGITITDQAFGGLGVWNQNYGSVGTGINLAFVKEVDVKTGAFEPKYGRSDGGIVEILTKSGGNDYHGALSAYFSPRVFFGQANQLYTTNPVTSLPSSRLSSPLYEASAELGGPVPGLGKKMFFFGAFDPTLKQVIRIADPNAALYSKGPYTYSTTTVSYAGKLTYVPFANSTLEASTYGDPSRRNSNPGAALTAPTADSITSSYNFGLRNSVIRLNQAITPTWAVLASYYYNHSHFTEKPLVNAFNISDRVTRPFVTSGFGTTFPTINNDYEGQIETEKKISFYGEHNFQIGYLYDHTKFENTTNRSGGTFAIPTANVNGTTLTTLYPNIPAGAAGQVTNASFRLFKADVGCTACAMYKGVPVYLQQIRGTYKGISVKSRATYHAAYLNDTFRVNRYVTVNAGARWEQQWYGGTVLNYLFNDNWSPRIGINIDPMGDQKGKLFFNFARYQNALPLDAAIRQLGNEQDDTNFYYTPLADANKQAIINPATGTVTVVPDNAHTLNGLPGKTANNRFGAPNFASSTGEGILKGTRMEYEDEYVIGFEHQVARGTVAKVRYMDRRLERTVEDIGSQCPECSNLPEAYAGGIANVSKTSDYFVNEKEVNYTPERFAALNGGNSPDQTTPATYKAAAPGCTYDNDTTVANGGYFPHPDGSNFPGSCVTNLATAGSLGADGIGDGFANPVRRYQAVEVELNRNFTGHWQARVNYRWAKLFGNYEGFFRNDNGQSDPGISSLFDFTTGTLGLLGDQFAGGYLNQDRKHTANFVVSYTVGKDSPHLGFANGFTVGTFLHAFSGTPLSSFSSHPIYGNAGEIPIGGRGNKGRTPTSAQLDLHLDKAFTFYDRFKLKTAFDTFNVGNFQPISTFNQNLDTSLGVSNDDFGKVTSWQGPFNARGSVVLQF